MYCRLLLLLVSALPVFGGFEQARELIRRGNFADALAESQRTLKAQPRNFQVWTLQGVAQQALGRPQDALGSFRRALKLRPDFIPALQGAAQIEYELRDPECRKTLERLVALRPEMPAAYGMLGALAYEAKDCPGAISHYGKAGPEAAANAVIAWQLGFCYSRLEQWEQAELQFANLLRMKEDDGVRFNLGLVQRNANKLEPAIQTLLPLSKRQPPSADAMSLLAAVFEANKQTPEALEVLRRAIDAHPLNERLYTDLADLCLEHRAIEIGTEVLEAGAKNIPSSARIQTMLGVLHSRAGLVEQAELAFKRAEALDPAQAYGRVGLAVAMLQMNAPEEAIHILQDQARRTPDDPRVNLTLAQAIIQKAPGAEELNRAETLLKRVIERDAGSAKAHALLGKLYFQREDAENARRVLETAVRLDDTDRTATYQLMILYRRAGREKEADKLQEKVRQLLEVERNAEADTGRYRLVRGSSESTQE